MGQQAARTTRVGYVGRTIKEMREHSGITRHALAKAARVDPAVLARLEEQNRPGVQFGTICRLAEALHVSLDDLAIAVGLKRTGKNSAKTGSSYPFVIARARTARGLLERALRDLDKALDSEK